MAAWHSDEELNGFSDEFSPSEFEEAHQSTAQLRVSPKPETEAPLSESTVLSTPKSKHRKVSLKAATLRGCSSLYRERMEVREGETDLNTVLDHGKSTRNTQVIGAMNEIKTRMLIIQSSLIDAKVMLRKLMHSSH